LHSYQRTGSPAESPEEKRMIYHLGAIMVKYSVSIIGLNRYLTLSEVSDLDRFGIRVEPRPHASLT
jgi:hypothetical protein